MKKFVGLWVLYLGTTMCAFSQVDTSYIYNTNMPYGTLDLRLAKSPTRYYYLQEGVTFSYRESAPGVRTNTYISMVNWNTSAYGQGNLREVSGSSDNFVMNYRLLPPKNYDPSFAGGYPIIIMFHGGGEAANCWIDARCHWATASYHPVTNSPPAPTAPTHQLLNNDRNLLHGGALHLAAVNLAGNRLPDDPTMPDRAFPGFVLFPQSLNGWGSHGTVEDAIRILRLLIKKYNIDENRVYVHGLSNGGLGVYQALKRAPWLFAAALPMSAIYDAGIITHGMVGEVSKVPLWIFQGGLDINPTPQRTYNYVRIFRDSGADVRYSFYPNLGHGTWNTAYNEPDFFTWILGKRKNNPHVSYGNPIICSTTQAGVQIAFAKGFLSYQWQRNGQTMPDATGAEITADTPGTYRGRFSRKVNPTEADWEPWSDPIIVSELYPEKPSIKVIGTAHLRGPGLASTDENNTVQLMSQDSAELYMWYKNGTPINFPGTTADDTLRTATFTSGYSSSSGAYTVVVESFNCPSPPSEPVNLFFNNSSPQNIAISAEAINFKGTVKANGIYLTWNDVSGVETGYELWRRREGTTDFRFVTTTGEDGISYHDQNLDPSTTYEYKLRAVNNSGRSNYLPSDNLGTNYIFTTAGDYHTPPPPQNLTAVSNTLNSITLSWKAAKDESSVKEYIVYYNNESVNTSSNATTYTLTNLPQNTAFAIKVSARDFGNHTSQPSNQIIATTYLNGLVYKHSTGAWESLDDSAMVATWQTPEFTGTVPNFTLQPRTQEDYFNFEFAGYLDITTEGSYVFNITSDDGSRLFLDGVLIADNDGLHGSRTVASEAIQLAPGPHEIKVHYFDDVAGHNLTVRYMGPGIGDGQTFVAIPDAALKSGTYVKPTPPAPPTGVTAEGTGLERVRIQWQFEDDGQTDYEVYRARSGSGPFEMVVRAKGITAVDSIGLLPGTLYYYKVKTVTNDGSSGFSSMASATTASDASPPTPPGELTPISKTLTTFAISWEPSTDNVGVILYEIFSGGELIGTSSIQAFTVEGLTPNTQYAITVKAVDASGNRSAASAPLSILTNPSAMFYSLPTGNLNELSSWRQNADGSGNTPENFSDNGQFFILSNRTSTSLGGAWAIGGNSSRVVVPTGVTLTADHPFSAKVELQGSAVLNLNHEDGPELVKLSPASTVNFNAYPTVPGNTYGSIILSGTTSKTFEADTITVLGNLTVNEGLALKGSPHNSTYLQLYGTMTLQGARPATAADNTIEVRFAGSGAQSITTGSDVYLYSISAGQQRTVDIVNPSGSPVKITLGSLKGGGLRLPAGSVLNAHDHDLILVDAATINPGQQTGAISTDGGDLIIVSTSDNNSNLNFASGHARLNYFEMNLTGSGMVAVRTPLEIVDGIKVKNGTLASGGNITLLASAEAAAAIYEIENTGRITGGVIVQQHVPAKGSVHHYLASPVSGLTVSEWQEAFAGGGESSLYKYTNGGWAPYPSGGSGAAPVERGVGYAALLHNTTQPLTLSVRGNPFQGSIPFELDAGSAGLSRWNLIGNPFASPVEWRAGQGAWTGSGIGNVMAIREEHTANGQVRSQVRYYDKTLGGGIIAAGQAFWVSASPGAPSLTIHESAKVSPEPDSTVVPARHLIVNLKQGELTDPAYIVFTAESTDAFDLPYDARKLENVGMFNLSTITADTVMLAVNHVGDAFCSRTVRLNISDVSPGSYALSFANTTSFSAIGEMVLTDHFAGSSTAITGNDYAFSVTDDPASFGAGRFAITFTKGAIDTATPKILARDVCPPGPGSLEISASQPGVSYLVVDDAGKVISDTVEGNGETIEIALLAGELEPGANNVRVTAGFAGCDRRDLGDAVINYTTELTVTTQGDVSICEGAGVTLEASGAPAGGFYRWFDGSGVLIEGATSSTLVVSEVLTETVYYVAAAHAHGCESGLAEIHIYADTLDMPVIRLTGDTLITDVVGYYQWRVDGEDIPGATLHYHIPVKDGNYTVVASNGGCYKESEPYALGDVAPVTGIGSAHDPGFVFSIYPVPSRGHDINVLLSTPGTEPVRVEIIDAMGRLHYSRTIDAGVLAGGAQLAPAAPLQNGIYFVRVSQAGIVDRKKFIVQD